MARPRVTLQASARSRSRRRNRASCLRMLVTGLRVEIFKLGTYPLLLERTILRIEKARVDGAWPTKDRFRMLEPKLGALRAAKQMRQAGLIDDLSPETREVALADIV